MVRLPAASSADVVATQSTPPPQGMTAFASRGKPQGSRAQMGPALILGGGLMALGSFLLWATANASLVGTISRSGVSAADGIFTALIGVMAVFAGLVAMGHSRLRFAKIGGIVAAVLAVVILAIDLPSMSDALSKAQSASGLVVASVGIGRAQSPHQAITMRYVARNERRRTGGSKVGQGEGFASKRPPDV